MTRVTIPPPQEECPECVELTSTECIVEEQSVPSLGLPAGSRLSKIIKYLDKKLKDFTLKFKKVIYNVTPTWTEGITIFSYENESCNGDSLDMKIPLFLNGKECFEYDTDNTVTYSNEDAYVMFFNHSHCGGVFIEEDDTIQITEISGVVLTTPIIIKNPGDTSFTFTNIILQALLAEVNNVTGSTFDDIVTDVMLTVNNDVGLGLVPAANASVAFLADLTFVYDVLDVSLVLKETVTENILSRPVSGVGIPNTVVNNFSVTAIMGEMTFYDAVNVEVTNQIDIDNLIQLIVDKEVRPVCCPDCSNLGATFTYTGADVDCGTVNLATAGDSMEDILTKVCLRFDTLGEFFNVFQPVSETNDNVNITINGSANQTSLAGDLTLAVDRIGCNDDIDVTINSVDGITFSLAATTVTMPTGSSTFITDWQHPTGLPAGTYNLTLTWVSCGLSKIQNITFILS